MTPIIGACFVLVLFLRKYTLKRTFVHAEDSEAPKTPTVVDDIEKGSRGDAAEEDGNEAATGAVAKADHRESYGKSTVKSTPDESKDGSTD